MRELEQLADTSYASGRSASRMLTRRTATPTNIHLLRHMNVPEPHEGQGIGQSLAKAALDFALQDNLTIVAQCPFIAGVVKRHPEYQQLVKPNASS